MSRADDAIPLAERVRDAIGRTSLDTSVGDLSVSASIGVAIGGAGDQPDELLTPPTPRCTRRRPAGWAKSSSSTATRA